MNIDPQQIQTSQPDVPCAECGRIFASSDVILLKNLWICGDCKPLFLQHLSEGARVTAFAEMWRVRNELLTYYDAPFPDRCVRCNAPAHGYRQKVVFFSPFAWKKAELHIGLCEKHCAQRKLGIGLAACGALGGFGLLIATAVGLSEYLALFGGILLFISGLICFMQLRAGIFASNIGMSRVCLRGVDKNFLAELPNRER